MFDVIAVDILLHLFLKPDHDCPGHFSLISSQQNGGLEDSRTRGLEDSHGPHTPDAIRAASLSWAVTGRPLLGDGRAGDSRDTLWLLLQPNVWTMEDRQECLGCLAGSGGLGRKEDLHNRSNEDTQTSSSS